MKGVISRTLFVCNFSWKTKTTSSWIMNYSQGILHLILWRCSVYIRRRHWVIYCFSFKFYVILPTRLYRPWNSYFVKTVYTMLSYFFFSFWLEMWDSSHLPYYSKLTVYFWTYSLVCYIYTELSYLTNSVIQFTRSLSI